MKWRVKTKYMKIRSRYFIITVLLVIDTRNTYMHIHYAKAHPIQTNLFKYLHLVGSAN